MADWKTIPDTDVDPDAPVTSELMYALRDNPVAIAEGAVGAPMLRVTQSSFVAPTVGSAYKLGEGSGTLTVITVNFPIMGAVFMAGSVSVSYTKSGSTGTVSLIRGSTELSSRTTNGTTDIDVNLASGDSLSIRIKGDNGASATAIVTSGTDAVATPFAGRYD